MSDRSRQHGNTRSEVLADILSDYSDYTKALLRIHERLDISDCGVGGSPEMLVAGLIVAEIVGGVALPPPITMAGATSTNVFGPTGEHVRVVSVSTQRGIADGLIEPDAGRPFDSLAIVAFIRAKPVAVHVIPFERMPFVAEAFSEPVFDDSRLIVSMLTHTRMMLDPVGAAAMGVRTIDLL